MSYEKDLEYLREELKNSEDKLRQAEMNGYVTDAEMWESDVENIRYQIKVHEEASKAGEYKAKAEAFDKILQQVDKESNRTTVETLLGTTKVLLHTRIGIYTHGVIKRMRNKDDKSLEDRLSELKTDYRIYDKEEQEELDEVYRKAEAFDRVKKEIRKNASYLFTKTPSEKRNAQIDILNGILIAMDNAEFDAEGEEAD